MSHEPFVTQPAMPCQCASPYPYAEPHLQLIFSEQWRDSEQNRTVSKLVGQRMKIR